MDSRDLEELERQVLEMKPALLYFNAGKADQYDFCLKTYLWMFAWAFGTFGLFCVSVANPSMLEQQQQQVYYAMLMFGLLLGVNYATFTFIQSARGGFLGYTLIALLIISAVFGFQCIYTHLIIKFPVSHGYLLSFIAIFFGIELGFVLGTYKNKSWGFWILVIAILVLYIVFMDLHGEVQWGFNVGWLVLTILMVFVLFTVTMVDMYLMISGQKDRTLQLDQVPYSVFLCFLNVLLSPVIFIMLICAFISRQFNH